MKLCPVCHKTFPPEAHFCPKDGAPLADIQDPYLGITLLGQFHINELIGQGSMGKVYLARQLSVDRHVAVKILKQKLAVDGNVVERFNREAKAAARLNHPNIVTVHLVGQMEGTGTPYLVMEYVEGASLEQVCASQGALDPLRVVKLTIQMATALAEAHRQHVVHRDLKPENIAIIKHSTPQECVKVLDFGIAKILHSEEEFAQLTKTGTIFGTPAYISPEQASGEALDFRTDLYSLGVIMYRMATGHLPFENASGLEILVRHIKDIPPKPSSFVPSMPEGLERIILKLLSKNRDDRHPTAEALLADLEDLKIQISAAASLPPQVSPVSSSDLKGHEVNDFQVKSGSSKIYIIAFFIIAAAVAAVFGARKYLKSGSSSTPQKPQTESNKTEDTTKTAMGPELPPEMKPDMAPEKIENKKPETPKRCEFNFTVEEKIRNTCGGHTVDTTFKIISNRRRTASILIYIPGSDTGKITSGPGPGSDGLDIKSMKKPEKDKYLLTFVLPPDGIQNIQFMNPGGETIYVKITAELKNQKKTRPKNGNTPRPGPGIMLDLPPLDVGDPMIPPPPMEEPMKKPKPADMTSTKPDLPDLPP
ncbi:serine/threonine protein kinase [Myxococcota bacterium]|nr:serine/threonine protein kinase [Myxococcota bacterium]MBU1380978.1 serine/threonine protein kinase [Myxococcota bacterium]MBU1498823.1 serine/threonine protein kinase [Myxococcota bacterium]